MQIRTPARPALHEAAKDGDVDRLARMLSQQDALRVDSLYLGQGPLHLAAKGGHVAAVALLLDRGAELHATATNTGTKNSALVADMGGATALHCAAEHNHSGVLSLLLTRGARLEARANCGDTPLHFAAREGWLEATRLLLAKGGDPHATNGERQTPHDLALLLGGGTCPCVDTRGRDWPAVAALLQAVMPLEAEARAALARKAWELPSAAALHDASESGDLETMKQLLAVGSHAVDARDYDGSTALHAATEGGHVAAVTLLLDSRADVRAANNYLDTALHVAARAGSLPVAQLLVAHGAPVDVANKFGVTPLGWARRNLPPAAPSPPAPHAAAQSLSAPAAQSAADASAEWGAAVPTAGEWAAVAALLEQEARDIASLPPAERAHRKIRAALNAQRHSRCAVAGGVG